MGQHGDLVANSFMVQYGALYENLVGYPLAQSHEGLWWSINLLVNWIVFLSCSLLIASTLVW